MPNVGPWEIILLLLLALLLFGAKRLPEMARSLGRSSREFKKGMREGADDDQDAKSKPTETKTDSTT